MTIVYLSLGSNIGDRIGYIQQAVSLLSLNSDINVVSTSSFYESEPWQMDSKNWFANAVVQISTKLDPLNLLKECQEIERQLGRRVLPHQEGYKDRTIDIDILFFDNKIISNELLTIPHKYISQRAFVLVPMLEIAQDFMHPVFNKTISQLYDDLETPEMVCLYGTRI